MMFVVCFAGPSEPHGSMILPIKRTLAAAIELASESRMPAHMLWIEKLCDGDQTATTGQS